MPAWIVARSICSAPASPSRLRQRVMLGRIDRHAMLKVLHAAEVCQ